MNFSMFFIVRRLNYNDDHKINDTHNFNANKKSLPLKDTPIPEK